MSKPVKPAYMKITIIASSLLLASVIVTSAFANESTKAQLTLTPSAILNCSYKYDGHDGLIKFKNGKAEGNFPGSTTFGWQCQVEKFATGDINGDDIPDAAMCIGYNGGGSGYFMNLVAMLNKNGKLVQGDSYDLGDRVEIKSLKITNGTINLVMMDHSSEEGLASASVRKTLFLKLDKKGKWQKSSR